MGEPKLIQTNSNNMGWIFFCLGLDSIHLNHWILGWVSDFNILTH